MSLQFTSIDDAFAPLQTKRKKREEREEREEREDNRTYEKSQVVSPPIHSQELVVAPPVMMDDLTRMQPYLGILFMIVVTGMLYDIRNAVMDARNILHDMSIKRNDL
mgnify:CR=1 FL=1|jgi:hypothetical protein